MLLALPPARAAGAECHGTVAGAVKGEFTCEVALTKKANGAVEFVITATDKVAKVDAIEPVKFEIPAPLTARTYAHEDLVSGAAAMKSGGHVYSASNALADLGDLVVEIQSLEKGSRVSFATGAVRANLVSHGGAKPGKVVMKIAFITGW